jgi:cell wall-associated NlpC family hydrolase
MFTTFRGSFARALTLGGALLLIATLFSVSAPVAGATTSPSPSTTTTTTTAPAPAPAPTTAPKPTFASRVISIVSSRRGSPYVYGAAGPHRFDCSGLTMWTFRKLNRRLPHSAAAQYGRVRHIRAADRRRGDLVFFHDGGGIYHVAIYAGHNQIWHAPYPGTRVRKERLWTRSVYYGRIR